MQTACMSVLQLLIEFCENPIQAVDGAGKHVELQAKKWSYA
jgi:hypothetical protein